MSSNKSIEILGRLKKITHVKTDSGLSEVLGVSPQTLSSWKGRGRIPYSICMEVAQDRGVSLDWLFGGQGPMLLQAPQPLVESVGRLTEYEKKLVLMFRVLNRSDQRAVYKVIEEKQQLQRLNEKVKELSACLEVVMPRD